MRIITGTARGRNLETLEGGDVTRPTLQRVKEAMFSAVQFRISGARCLDMFAGSGQLGIEALSRGASLCLFVDQSRAAAGVVQRNLKSAGLYQNARVITGDSISFAQRCREKFDLIFIDPPFAANLYDSALAAAEKVCADGAQVLVETTAKLQLPEQVGALTLFRRYKHGNTAVWLFRMPDDEPLPGELGGQDGDNDD